MTRAPVIAAGAVCWRNIDGVTHILVIHRNHRRDVSLPKGKLDPGEGLPAAAVREIREETGFRLSLGLPLGATHYLLPNGRAKEVHYWAAHVSDRAIARSTFLPNSEVAALEWLPIDKARRELHYNTDREIVDIFASRLDEGVIRTFAIVLVRHGNAIDPAKFKGEDADRPLTKRGLAQAESLASNVAAFGPRKLFSSASQRCRQTMEQLAHITREKIIVVDEISQHLFVDDHPALRKLVGKRIRKGRTTVFCSHGPVIPEILREMSLAIGTPLASHHLQAAHLDTGAFSVFHLSTAHPAAGIVAVETHDPIV